MASIQWNEKADRYLSPLQRDSYERGEAPRRLDGRLHTDERGDVWFRSGEHVKLVGQRLATGDESAAERDLDAPATTNGAAPSSRKRARKPKARK